MQQHLSRLVVSTLVALAAVGGSVQAQQHDTTDAKHDTTTNMMHDTTMHMRHDSTTMQMDMGAMQSADTLTATLSGAEEVPGPGDSTATGKATVTLDEEQVCYTLSVTGLASATAAHIHKGAAGEAGDVVVPLQAPKDGSAEGCAKATSDVIAGIRENPAGYYVNVHDSAHPKGAIRGQLSK